MLDDKDVFVNEASLRASEELLDVVRDMVKNHWMHHLGTKRSGLRWCRNLLVQNSSTVDRALRIVIGLPEH